MKQSPDQTKNTNPAIAFFAKTPELSRVKTRLATSIGEKAAKQIYCKSLACIKELDRELAVNNITPYWALAEHDGQTHPRWHKMSNTLFTGEGGLGTRQFNIYNHLITQHPVAMLCGTDTPQLTTKHILTALSALKNTDFVMIGAKDGGYVLLGGKKPISKQVFENVPYSVQHTGLEMSTALKKHGTVTLIEPMTDIDTIEDLCALQNEWPKNKSVAQQDLQKAINTVLTKNLKSFTI